jgi:hypothetical protein
MRRKGVLLPAILLPALACGEGTNPPLIPDATLLASRLASISGAVATPPLKGLASIAIPMTLLGVDVHNMSPDILGRTVEWGIIHNGLIYTDRTGAPAGALRLVVYALDSIGRPAYPLVEVGTADLYPYNTFNGGGPDSMSLRFVVTDTRTTPLVVADFLAHSHADPDCQCATVEGWASDGTTRVDFSVPYNIPVLGDGRFPGDFAGPATEFAHFATLPGPGANTSTATIALRLGNDSLTATSGLLRARGGKLTGDFEIRFNGDLLATATRSATGFAATGANGHSLTPAERDVVSALSAIPADIAYYIEWPTFVIFFCGC